MAVDIELYGGEVIMRYDPKKHLYTANNVLVPSVTKITGVIDKPALQYWAVNETLKRVGELWQPDREYSAEQIKAGLDDAKGARWRTSGKALNIGSMAHDWVEQYIKSRAFGFSPPPMPDYEPVANSVNAFIKWDKENSPKYLSSERKVYSRTYMYSGTTDIDLEMGGRRYAADIKTSKGIYPEYYLQCAAYAKAIEEEAGNTFSFDGLLIIRIDKETGEIEVGLEEDVQKMFDVFHACLVVWRWKNDWKPEPIA